MLKQFMLKSHFVNRLSRKYRLNRNQPSWSGLLTKDAGFWNAALDKAKNGPMVLIATNVGAYLAGTTIESMLAVALTLRGADVHVLLCDGVLPACLACTYDIYPNMGTFAKKGPSGDCNDCFRPAQRMYASLGITTHRYSDYLSQDEIIASHRMASDIPFQDIGRYSMNGVSVGEHALAGALRYFAVGILDKETFGEPILRRYFNASLLTMHVVENLLGKYIFSTAVFHHGIYVPQGIVGEVCRKNGIHVVNWNPAYREKCFIFSHNDTYHHTMVTEPVEKWNDMSWTAQKETQLEGYLKSRWRGTQDWIWFHEKPKFDVTEIAAKWDIDFNKPCIGMLTSVMWDAVLHYPSNAFSSMLEWITCTIDYFVKRPELQLLIRVHPAEIRGTLPSRQRIVEEIKQSFPKLPRNIIVIPPESDVSTYALMTNCDTVIIYNTKTGIELAALGIPVVVAGEAWIRRKGFAIDVNNEEDYTTILDRLPLNKRMDEEDTMKARKYAYHFFFKRMIPLSFMERTRINPPFKVSLSHIEQLSPGNDAGLDVICNGILSHSDFIYPS